MGVSGSGKTVVGGLLAERLDWLFLDADDYHPATNISKMSSGKALSDEDRNPWLFNLRELVQQRLAEGQSSVLACSALKKSYREILLANDNRIHLVYLAGDFDLIYSRMQSREGHYMKEGMLRSQFATLEPPKDAIEVLITSGPECIVDTIIGALIQHKGI
ncbi:MAG: gluconate kinase [Trueperaceae bacterium]|nr:gluconate kinase [Trueperaceae bacterium]